jgi:hypothetical protein
LHVDLQSLFPHLVPPLVIRINAAVPKHDGRVVHQHIDSLAPCDCVLPKLLSGIRLAKVGFHKQLALRRDTRRSSFGSVAIRCVMDNDVSACRA